MNQLLSQMILEVISGAAALLGLWVYSIQVSFILCSLVSLLRTNLQVLFDFLCLEIYCYSRSMQDTFTGKFYTRLFEILRFVEQLSKKYGPVLSMKIGYYTVFVHDPNIIHDAYLTHASDFEGRSFDFRQLIYWYLSLWYNVIQTKWILWKLQRVGTRVSNSTPAQFTRKTHWQARSSICWRSLVEEQPESSLL